MGAPSGPSTGGGLGGLDILGGLGSPQQAVAPAGTQGLLGSIFEGTAPAVGYVPPKEVIFCKTCAHAVMIGWLGGRGTDINLCLYVVLVFCDLIFVRGEIDISKNRYL